MPVYKVPYKRIVTGYAVVEADTAKQAYEHFRVEPTLWLSDDTEDASFGEPWFYTVDMAEEYEA